MVASASPGVGAPAPVLHALKQAMRALASKSLPGQEAPQNEDLSGLRQSALQAMWRCLLGAALASLADEAAGAVLRRSGGFKAEHFETATGDNEVPEKDLMDMLTSLNEIVVSADKEHKAFEKLSSARGTACQTTETSLQQSISEGSQSIKTAQVELSKAMSEVESIQGDVTELKSQVKTVEDEVAALQKQLTTLRTERQAAVARDSGYTREVKAILSKAKQRIDQVWSRSGAHKLDEAAELLQGDSKDSDQSGETGSEAGGRSHGDGQRAAATAGLLCQDQAMGDGANLRQALRSRGQVPQGHVPALKLLQNWLQSNTYDVHHTAAVNFSAVATAYGQERRENVPVTKVPLMKAKGFKAVRNQTYIDIRPATPSVASNMSRRSRASFTGRSICSQPRRDLSRHASAGDLKTLQRAEPIQD
eukprot:s1048_g18.t1